MVSRVSGVARILVVPAVFGASAIGDMFLAVNALPQTFFAIFGGQALSSLLVPMLVRAFENNPAHAELLARRSLGIVIALLAMVTAVGLALHRPLASALASGIESSTNGAGDIAALLLLLILPQVVLYGCIAVFVAVQHSRGRFLLPSIAPIVENIGLVVAVVIIAQSFTDVHLAGAGDTSVLVALGIGSTCALLAHLAVQALGVATTGSSVLPLRPHREPEINDLSGPAKSSLAWTVFLGPRFIGLAIAAGWAGAGGIQSIQIGLLVQNLPMALVGYPIAAALLPRLAKNAEGSVAIAERYASARNLAIWLLLPLGAGMLFLAGPLGDTLAVGRFADDGGGRLVTMSIAGLAAAAICEALYEVARQATLAYGDLRGFRASIVARAGLSLTGIPLAVVIFDGPELLLALGLVVSISDFAGLALIDAPLRRATTSASIVRTNVVRAMAAAAIAGCAGLAVAKLAADVVPVVRLMLSGTTLLVMYTSAAWLLTRRGADLKEVLDAARHNADTDARESDQ